MHTPDQVYIEQLISRIDIPALAHPIEQLQHLINSADVDIKAIVRLIEQEAGLSDAILAIINSPFNDSSQSFQRIESIITKFGLDTLFSFCAAIQLKKQLTRASSPLVNSLCTQSSAVANAMLFIGQKAERDIPPSLLYAIGTFHNAGMSLIAQRYEDYESTLAQATAEHVNSLRLEQQHYGLEHATLAYLIASHWNLSANICQLILHQHDIDYFDYASHSYLQIAFSILKAGEQLVHRAQHQTDAPDWPEFKRVVLLILGISANDMDQIYSEYLSVCNKIH